MQSFRIHFDEAEIHDLHQRLDRIRLPQTGGNGWRFGTDERFLTDLTDYWRHHYDWRKTELKLNRYLQFLCEINGVKIHFFHIKSKKKKALPLLLTHGWPDSFLRYAKLFDLLNDYDLVVPSLPGFAFSGLPEKGFCNNAETAALWHDLMTEKLGYTEYVAVGGDMGRGVTCYLAEYYPDEVKGIHLTDVGLVRELLTANDTDLNEAESAYKRNAQHWLQFEGAYINIHSTKPQSLAYALSDSPVGMAAWLLEKYQAWSDWALLSKDDLCDCLTLYWLTNTAGSSIYAYYANSFTLPPLGNIRVPTAIAAFPHDVLPPPREWIEKNYPVVLYTEMPRGGHFTALEQPEVFAEHLKQFVQIIST